MNIKHLKNILAILLSSSFILNSNIYAQGKEQQKINDFEKKAIQYYEKGDYKLACEYFIKSSKINECIKSSKINNAIFLFFLVDAIGLFIFLYLEKQRAYKKLVRKNMEWASRTTQIKNYSNINNEINQKDKDILNNLVVALTNKKIYLNKELNINDMAKQLGTNRSVLSKIINVYFNKNFPALLNEYRINEAIILLTDNKTRNYKMEAIGEMCGYNNRQVFHAAFKRETGVTPNDFRIMSNRKDINED